MWSKFGVEVGCSLLVEGEREEVEERIEDLAERRIASAKKSSAESLQ